MPNIDLHCHSTISDGVLSPGELVSRAAENGVEVLALTDHDDCDGLVEARRTATLHGMKFLNGVEISVTWRGRTLHIVGLNIDPESENLRAGLEFIRQGRIERAGMIADGLSRAGISGSLEGAFALAGNKNLIGRTHFARYLVEKGYARDVQAVFRKFLVKGKPGHVAHQWAELSAAVGWIRTSGGMAVIAHPGRYELSAAALKALLLEFKEAGGEGIEVVTSSHTLDMAIRFCDFAKRFELFASLGSDFHSPDESRMDIGRLPPLPQGCRPIWEGFA
ncbi:MAG: PHP domain-containing protein [Burkholderiales bacterium]|nr:PHP domain-containing protein [Burkholderiales bacterium]